MYMSCAKRAEVIKIVDSYGPNEYITRRTNAFTAAIGHNRAMRPIATSLRTLVIIIMWADISAKLSPVCPAKCNANSLLYCVPNLWQNKFDLNLI